MSYVLCHIELVKYYQRVSCLLLVLDLLLVYMVFVLVIVL